MKTFSAIRLYKINLPLHHIRIGIGLPGTLYQVSQKGKSCKQGQGCGELSCGKKQYNY